MSPTADGDPLDGFTAPTRAYFSEAFPGPTPAQEQAWSAITSGEHALIVAPTGSGKTLAAFLWALDRLALTPRDADGDGSGGCRVLYVSPLKALASDVERNLRAPAAGIRQHARRLGVQVPRITISVRSGDTPAAQRRAFTRSPSDILITTPESLFLLLTSRAREALRTVTTVIVDEVHAVAGTKRGTHLGLSLERLDELLPAPAQRIGLSATVRPVAEAARWLTGSADRPVRVLTPDSTKRLDLSLVAPTVAPEPEAPGTVRDPSTWPRVEERVVDLITAHRSTLVFTNSRRLAERLTARINESWTARAGAGPPADLDPPDGLGPPAEWPAQVSGQSGVTRGVTDVLARTHHGSLSRERRATVEAELKAGRLPAVVATSSLELGIDMGEVDLAVQIGAPPSVAAGLQRIGRAGHQVSAISRGVLFPTHRGELIPTAVSMERMRSGLIEQLRIPTNPLDVLAQQIVAMVAMDDHTGADLLRICSRSASFADLSRPLLDSVLDMLSGRYPAEEFAGLRPRLVWDRDRDLLTARPGAQSLAVTSGGTIPDRGLFGVFLADVATEGSGPGRRVGELDEEMVHESRVGDVITLGSSSWRIAEIGPDRVLVAPAPGRPGRLPFWKGDAAGRPAELGRAIGAFTQQLDPAQPDQARSRAREAGLEEQATEEILRYLDEQRTATGTVPDNRTIVVERVRDDLGDWRIVVHCTLGSPVTGPWSLLLSARFRKRFGVEVQADAFDDGIVLHLADLGTGQDTLPDLTGLLRIPPQEVTDEVAAEVQGSSLFAARFRENAARSLLFPAARPGVRRPLWQQRQRSTQLLQVASRYPEFPIVLETVRECLLDVFDLPSLVELMEALATGEIDVVEVDPPAPSPFARALLFGYTARFLYDGDAPSAERRAAALSLDPSLLSELIGPKDQFEMRELLDCAVIERTEAELQLLTEQRRARDLEQVADLVRRLGPVSLAEICRRTRTGSSLEPDRDVVTSWVEDLHAQGRIIPVTVAAQERWAVVEDAGRLRHGLGITVPERVPKIFGEPVADPMRDLLLRFARSHGPFTAAEAATWLGLEPTDCLPVLYRLSSERRLAQGALRPADCGGDTEEEFCDTDVLATLRRRSLTALRQEIAPVPPTALARFWPVWQQVARPGQGRAGLLRAVQQLAGLPLPLSTLESFVLPARVQDYTPVMLDDLLATGEVFWSGHGELPDSDGWIALHPMGSGQRTVLAPGTSIETAGTEQLRSAVLEVLATGGAQFFRRLAEATGDPGDDALARTLWDLVWSGLVTNDTMVALRRRRAEGSRHRRTRASTARSLRRARSGLSRSQLARPVTAPALSPGTVPGRWSLLPPVETDPTRRVYALSEQLIDRYGVLGRATVSAEDVPGGFSAVSRVLTALEESGRLRRGYFVDGLGGAQFAHPDAVELLRTPPVAEARDGSAVVLAAVDPANPYGAALPWPERATSDPVPTSRNVPGRRVGTLVVLLEGDLVLHLDRGGRSVSSWTTSTDALTAAARALAGLVRRGSLTALTLQQVDGVPLLRTSHPLARALTDAGFHATPRGFRLR